MGGEQYFPMHWEVLFTSHRMKKGKGSCCSIDFMTFLKFSLKCREENPCREAARNALSQTCCSFSPIGDYRDFIPNGMLMRVGFQSNLL
jgi:hypothetical protein